MKNLCDNFDLQRENNTICISGSLTQTTVMQALARCQNELPSQGSVHLNLKGITQCDSASLAFLLALFRECKKKKIDLQILDMPQQMQDISRVTGLEKILSF